MDYLYKRIYLYIDYLYKHKHMHINITNAKIILFPRPAKTHKVFLFPSLRTTWYGKQLCAVGSGNSQVVLFERLK